MKLGGERLEAGCDALQAGGNVGVGMRCPREASIQLSKVQSSSRVVGVDDDPVVLEGGRQDGGSWVVEDLQAKSIAEQTEWSHCFCYPLSSRPCRGQARFCLLWGSPSFHP